MRCGVCHAPASTGRTPSPSFARKSKQAIVPAGFATKAEKSSRQNSAVKKRTKFPFDELRTGRSRSCCLEEGFKLLGDDALQHAFFRMTRDVFNRACQHAPASRQELSQLK